MVKLRDAIELTKNKAVKDNRYTDLFGKSELGQHRTMLPINSHKSS